MDYIFKIFRDRGFKIWLVGGALRDYLLHREPADLDFVVDGHIDSICSISGGKIIGPTEAPLCLLRRDSRTVEISVLKGPSIEEDLSTRDFTINAIALDWEKRIIDPFYGSSDLQKKIIRFVGNGRDRLVEDPIRAVRFCRFMASLSFKCSEKSWFQLRAFLKEKGGSLFCDVSEERIGREIVKGLSNPLAFLDLLYKASLLKIIFPLFDEDKFDKLMISLSLLERSEKSLEISLVLSAIIIESHWQGGIEKLTKWSIKGRIKKDTVQTVKCYFSLKEESGPIEIGRFYRLFGAQSLNRAILLYEAMTSIVRKRISPLKSKRSLYRLIESRLENAFKCDYLISGDYIVDKFSIKGPSVGVVLDDFYDHIFSGDIQSVEDLERWSQSLT